MSELKAAHLKTLSFPLDAYWEAALIGLADHYELTIDGERAGYFCLNQANALVAFFLQAAYWDHGEAALAWLVKTFGTPTAFPHTNDPFFLSLCLDIARKTEVHTYLFQDFQRVDHPLQFTGEYTFTRATEHDLPQLYEHYRLADDDLDANGTEAGSEDLRDFIRTVLKEHHIFMLLYAGALVATSELRVSKTQKPYADLGMIVAPGYRRQGLGSYMLNCTKAYCYEHNLRPICSCEVTNIGSKKAILKAGFVSRHRVVRCQFTEPLPGSQQPVQEE